MTKYIITINVDDEDVTVAKLRWLLEEAGEVVSIEAINV